MAEKHLLPVSKIIDIYEAIKSIDSNKNLDTKVAYRVARLSDKCKGIIESYEKTRDKIRDKYIEESKSLNPNDSGLSEDQKKDLQLKINEINGRFNKEIAELVSENEEIEIFGFVLSDFEGKDIPIKFFIAMGDLIKE